MATYQAILEKLPEKRLASSSVCVLLLVDKEEIMKKCYEVNQVQETDGKNEGNE